MIYDRLSLYCTTFILCPCHCTNGVELHTWVVACISDPHRKVEFRATMVGTLVQDDMPSKSPLSSTSSLTTFSEERAVREDLKREGHGGLMVIETVIGCQSIVDILVSFASQ